MDVSVRLWHQTHLFTERISVRKVARNVVHCKISILTGH